MGEGIGLGKKFAPANGCPLAQNFVLSAVSTRHGPVHNATIHSCQLPPMRMNLVLDAAGTTAVLVEVDDPTLLHAASVRLVLACT